ncbi:acetyl-CoA acetyltransferase [Halobacteriales archaeon QS_5_70_15]|nr:MAG: acetyl-CoA acetyltransferase [Halobacteriales archaeon QS_5_70_15]
MAFEDVVVAGIGETGKHRPSRTNDQPYHTLEEYFRTAAELTLADAGLEWGDVDGLGVARPSTETPYRYPLMVAETLGFEDLRWLTCTDHCGGQGVPLLAQAAMAVDAGMVESVLCLGADTPKHPEKGSGEVFPRDPRGFAREYVDPFGLQGANALLAMAQRRHMDRYGTTVEQLGELYVTQRESATRNPLAYFDEPVELEEYVNSEPIADPIRLFDCVVPVNAGFGFLLTTPELAADLGVDPVSLRGVGNSHNPEVAPRREFTAMGIGAAGERAFGMADATPGEMDFLQLYDDYPIVELIQLEELGYTEPEVGGEFLERTAFAHDGDLPVNTGGGQLCVGQAGVGGAAFVQVLEAVRQLRGDGGERQVPGAETGLVTGVGAGQYGKNLTAHSVAVLERGGPA